MTTSLDELLNVFWLRPETAVWRELDIRAMQDFEFSGPSLDLGCGDGIFSFIRAGGEFEPSFDAFQDMNDLEHYFDNVDVFDSFDGSLSPTIKSQANYQIDWAFDQKDNLLKKAGTLGLYKNFKQGDANEPLPFEAGQFKSVFSNIVYWLDDPQAVLSEISRILMKNGVVCLMLPNDTFPKFSFYHQLYANTSDEKWAFLKYLDRGRFSDSLRQSRSADDWENMFREAGLEVIANKPHLSKPVIQMWDVGLRPLFPMLHKMVGHLDDQTHGTIKQEWIDTLKRFLVPMIENDAFMGLDEAPAFHCYFLKK